MTIRPTRPSASVRVRPLALLAAVGALAGVCGTSSGQLQPTYLQIFENEWDDIERRVADIFLAGYNHLWTPPPSRGSDPFSVGYDCFDRFDLGQPPLFDNSSSRRRTAYGTEGTFRSMIEALHRAGIQVHIDAVLNHNSGRSTSDAFFADGGWPGFHVPRSQTGGVFRDKLPTDDWGDFHAGVAGGFLQSENPGAPRYDLWRGDLVALVDIDQTRNDQFIRQPVAQGDPMNIPAGNVRNRPDPANARFYPDTDATPVIVNNPLAPDFDGNGQPDPFTFYPFTQSPPGIDGVGSTGQGDPVAENATGYLMRWVRWMLEVQGVDGFRLDASKHTFPFFWDQYFDAAVSRGRVLPDGARATPFTFGENTTGNADILANYYRKDSFATRDALDLAGAGALRDLVNAGGFGTWANVFNNHLDTTDDGLQNGSAGVFHLNSHDNGSLGDGSSRPPLPTARQQGWFAHAYLLMRPGRAIVYHNARGTVRTSGFFPREGTPIALGFDPATQTANDTITNLVRLRHQYGYADYFPLNANVSDVLAFQRARNVSGSLVADVLVGVSDRYDSGVDGVTVTTNFSQGQRLIELTGNAADPAVDPANLVPDVITVGAGGVVNLVVPRNTSSVGEHNKGFVVYGPPVPGGDITVIDSAPASPEVIPPDANSVPDFVQRLATIPIVRGDTFRVRLTTFAQDAVDNTSDDNALFRIDDGYGDYNASGAPDFPPGQFVLGGFEQFTDLRTPGMTRVSRAGEYEQIIDAEQLGEGFHYIQCIAFRPRPSGTTPLFGDFREVVYIDREEAGFTLAQAGLSLDEDRPEFAVRSDDATVDQVYVFLNLPQGTDPTTMLGLSSRANRYDAREWRRTDSQALQPGANTVTVVAVEHSGRNVVRQFTVNLGTGGCNAADVAADFGVLNVNDVIDFVNAFNAGGSLADVSPAPGGDGALNVNDIIDFVNAFNAGCP